MKQEKSTFKLSDGTECDIHTFRGEVIDRSTGHVVSVEQGEGFILPSSRGDGGFNMNYIPGQVSSTVHQKQTVWLHDAAGGEESFNLDAVAPLEVRNGHQMSVAYVSSSSTQSWWIAGAKNHKTGRAKTLDNAVTLNQAFAGAVPTPMRNYSGSWLLWALLIISLAAGMFFYVSAGQAHQSRWRADSVVRRDQCESPGMWWTPARHAANKACIKRANTREWQVAVDKAYGVRAAADRDFDRFIISLIGSGVVGFFVLIAMGIRRGMFRKRMFQSFVDGVRDATGAALAAAH